MKTSAFNLVTLVMFAVAFLTCGAPPAKSAETLRIGMYQNPPKIFRDEQGRPAGF